MTEKTLEERFVKRIKQRGGIAYKFVSPSNAGVPDRIVLLPQGKIGFVEVKSPEGGKLSRLQEHTLNKLRLLGFKCFILRDKSEIDKVIDEIRAA